MQLQSLPDKKLIRLYKAGNEAALEVLINRYKDKIYSYIFFKVKDTYLAEDIFQDTFVKVVDTLRSGRYREEDKFLPWVVRIGHNLCIDHFRKTKRTPTVVNSDGFDIFEVLTFADESPQDKYIKDQTADKVRTLVNDLPDEQKQVLILRHYSDMSFKEISDLTGVSINTALGRMRYAIINLRKLMAEKNISM
jgi:RNA polymerase sigma factor (sigma-70 family)